jgi:hypothetical protein
LSTSNSWNFNLTVSNLITEVAENLGIVESGGDVLSADQTTIARTLNIIAKEHSGPSDGFPGLKVFHRQRVHLFLTAGQNIYEIGPNDSRATTLYGRTTLAASETAGDFTLTITDNEDTTTFPGTTVTMTNGDTVGIQLTDGTIQWTTISGTPSSSMDIDDALTGDAASGSLVWWYTAKAQRLSHVESVILRNADNTDTPLGVYTEAREYDQGIADKFSEGQPGAVLIEYLANKTRVTFNSLPDDPTMTVIFTGSYASEDYDADEDIAFPQEWYGYLCLESTLRASIKYPPWQPSKAFMMNYENARTRVMNLNPENTRLYFQCGEAG